MSDVPKPSNIEPYLRVSGGSAALASCRKAFDAQFGHVQAFDAPLPEA